MDGGSQRPCSGSELSAAQNDSYVRLHSTFFLGLEVGMIGGEVLLVLERRGHLYLSTMYTPSKYASIWHYPPNKIPGEKEVLWLILFSDCRSFLGKVIHNQFFSPPKSFKMDAYFSNLHVLSMLLLAAPPFQGIFTDFWHLYHIYLVSSLIFPLMSGNVIPMTWSNPKARCTRTD